MDIFKCSDARLVIIRLNTIKNIKKNKNSICSADSLATASSAILRVLLCLLQILPSYPCQVCVEQYEHAQYQLFHAQTFVAHAKDIARNARFHLLCHINTSFMWNRLLDYLKVMLRICLSCGEPAKHQSNCGFVFLTLLGA